MARNERIFGPLVSLTAVLATCAALAAAQPRTGMAGQASSGAGHAELKNAQGEMVGTARLTPTPNGILLRVELDGLPPGEHAIHVHQVGRCEAPQFTSAGEHLGPEGRKHGFLDPSGPHAGDLPNLHMPSIATTVEYIVDNVTLENGPTPLLDRDGSALVIHADADDYQTEPGGTAGDRIACGVIEKV